MYNFGWSFSAISFLPTTSNSTRSRSTLWSYFNKLSWFLNFFQNLCNQEDLDYMLSIANSSILSRKPSIESSSPHACASSPTQWIILFWGISIATNPFLRVNWSNVAFGIGRIFPSASGDLLSLEGLHLREYNAFASHWRSQHFTLYNLLITEIVPWE